MQEIVWKWFLSDFLSRRMPPWSIILVNTRWHELDLSGRIRLSGWNEDSFKRIYYPAIDKNGEVLWPDRYPKEEVEDTRDFLLKTDPYTWHALYQGTPTPDEGNFFKRDWFWTYENHPPVSEMKVYGASDYAVTDGDGDFTVHAVIGVDPEGVIWVLDLWREQAASDVWVAAMVGKDATPDEPEEPGLFKRWKPQAWVEEAGQIERSIGPFLAREQVRRNAYTPREQFTSAHDKPTRARSWQAIMATPGAVRWPKGGAVVSVAAVGVPRVPERCQRRRG